MSTSTVNRSSEVLSLQKQEAFEASRRLAITVRDSMAADQENTSLVLQAQDGPNLPAPKKQTSADNAMSEFCAACTDAFEASASASNAQTTNITGLNKLDNALEYSILYSTQVEVAKEQAEQQIENKLASAIDDAQKRESGVGSALGWTGFAIVTAMVLAELIFSAGAAAPAAAEEEAGAAALAGGDEAGSSEEGIEMTSLGNSGGSLSDLEADQAEVEDEMASSKSDANNVQDNAKGNAEQTTSKGQDDGVWNKFKNKVQSGCRTITQKLRPNPQSYLYRGVKFAMQVTGTVTAATPQIIKGVDGIAISQQQSQLADCQQQLGELKGALQGNMAVATAFETLNKKAGDLANDLVGQTGADISISGSAFTTWGRVEIEG